MAAQLPGAETVGAYWRNLCEGVESIARRSADELAAAGESALHLRDPHYVPAAAILDQFDGFDAEFFGLSPKDAAIMDPQHRKFLESCWNALEDAGHVPESFPGPIGVFAGCGMGSYFYFNLCSNRELVDGVGMFLLRHTGNDKDFLATRASHLFDLTGPSVNVQTACSTSLVAVHLACQSLASGECDMALAGGVTIELPHGRGYLYKENEILSPDGHCRAFDHRAQGTVFGSGTAVVVLRRLADALADGDHIWAVVRGSAINNDGAAKAGYLAPSVEGQAAAVAEALVMSGTPPDSVGYVECHGTGTPLGDPIEIAALNHAFARVPAAAARAGPCLVGSVKTNIGHLDTAAGTAGLVKAALAVHHGRIPPTLGFSAPNPAIDFAGGPFRVADRLADWPEAMRPRRAGVNSLGVGGTNAHVVLEEPPPPAAAEDSDWPFHIFTVSGRSRAALDDNAAALAGWLEAHPDADPADISHTLVRGRRRFERRRVLVAHDPAEAAALLRGGADNRRVFDAQKAGDDPRVVFMFPGGGAQYAGMARGLYDTEPVFREWMDRGLAHLATLGPDLRPLWLPEPDATAAADAALMRPSAQLPLLMIVEYALARLWMAWGVTPAALIGHSMGENAAACLAGVMSFEDCIGLVHLRGTLFDGVAPGGMLSVPLAPEGFAAELGDLDLAAVNAPSLSVVSGPQAALDDFAAAMAARGVETQKIAISIAAHSRMLEDILPRFRAYLAGIRLSAPQIPIISNRTGRPLTDAEATDPDYWTAHLRGTVHFAEGIAHLSADPATLFVEVGPGRAMSSMAGANPGVRPFQVISTLRHRDQAVGDDLFFINALARLWAAGGDFDWAQIWGDAARRRLPLPGYQFQRKRYFIERSAASAAVEDEAPARIEDPAGWGWRPVWRLSAPAVELDALGAPLHPPLRWLVLADEMGVADRVADRLRAGGHAVTLLRAGDRVAQTPEGLTLPPEAGRDGYAQMLGMLDAPVDRIAHFWGITSGQSCRPGSSVPMAHLERGFFSLLHLAQALGSEWPDANPALIAVCNDALSVAGEPAPHPEKMTATGPVRMLPREGGGPARLVDVRLPPPRRGLIGRTQPDEAGLDRLADALLEELLAPVSGDEPLVAWRGGRRLVQQLAPLPLAPHPPAAIPPGAVTLITGGFGGIGQALAQDLARRGWARLVLTTREPLDGQSARSRAVLEAVAGLRAAGAEVLAVTADPNSAEDMTAAVDAAVARFGPVDSVLHAAGLTRDGLMAGKSDDEAWDVLAPKMHGTDALIAALRGRPPRLTVLFASTSTAIAPAGQADYVAANEYLNAIARQAPPELGRVVAVNWGVWADTGMAARATGAVRATPAEPVAHAVGAAPNPATTSHEPEAGTPASGPLLGLRLPGDDALRFVRRLSAADWVIDEHRTESGQALLPGTGSLEILAEAAREAGLALPLTLRGVEFLRPVLVPDGAEMRLSVEVARVEDAARITLSDGAGDGANVTALVVPLADPAPPPPPAPPPAPGGWDEDGGGRPLASAQAPRMRFGPRWQVLRRHRIAGDAGVAELALDPAYAGDLAQGYLLHPALMDIATGWAMPLIPGWTASHLWVPLGYDQLDLWRPLPARVTSHVRLTAATGGMARFDVTLTDPEGAVCCRITGFALRRLDTAAAGFTAGPEAAPAHSAHPVHHDPGERRLAHLVAQGIPAAEGPRALDRAVASGLPQLYISSMDLPALVADAARPPEADRGGQSFERPEMDADYVPPAPGTQSELATIWAELLGVAQIGAEDSFFDLGGHSLIAVRMFNQLRKVFGVDLPISTLFETPTIAGLARLVEERAGPRATPDAAGTPGTQPAPVPHAPTRRHLVPMGGQGGATGGTPFFLVAGMFGNVMNLRHLAQRVGADRPFYGLQARGLFGEDRPHEDFAEAARDYLAEVRQVQPRGPYLLGGFSGGGLIALEMARALKAEGEAVAQLVLLDTPLPQRPVLSRRDKLMIRTQQLKAEGPAFLAAWARDKLSYELARRRQAGAANEPEAFHDRAIEAAFRAALPRVALAPWEGPVTLFRPPLDRRWKVSGDRWVTTGREYLYGDNGWGDWMPALRVVEVPGDHDSMVLEPNVRRLGTVLRDILRAADRTGPRMAAE
ncbi:type I polyketide synthase [Paracoccus sanguinis]|uniref:type I polyketide synthase n=1 Tax=Paracoccus sanguinis TaxID=1545044 RepID=UPI001FCFB303|nr:type I polyketide synthase [Paracoccus sanguinis]